jgi:hypothetical protein
MKMHKNVQFNISLTCNETGPLANRGSRGRQQAAAPYSRSWSFPMFKYHFKSNRVFSLIGGPGGASPWPSESRRRPQGERKNGESTKIIK